MGDKSLLRLNIRWEFHSEQVTRVKGEKHFDERVK